MLDKIQIFVSIVASLIVTLISIYQDVSLDTLAIRLIVVIIAFYALGLAARIYLKKYVFFTPPEEAMDEVLENPDSAEEGENMADGSSLFENLDGSQPKMQRSKYD
ncbi:MAG: hypothetical protein FWE20_06970 [Defluviitaleaceae bacterium]|nr:hypothetical protein [Defluviitaleaceae bacterium]